MMQDTVFIKTNNINKEWKLQANENYEKLFANRKKETFSPKLSFGCYPCTKYHVKGYYFKDCKNVHSHKVLSGGDKAKTDKFIKEIRGK